MLWFIAAAAARKAVYLHLNTSYVMVHQELWN